MRNDDRAIVLWDTASPLSRWLHQIEESELRVVVRDLLRAMGYGQVMITHGQLEFGRDLVFSETDKIGRQIWRGVQVKTQPVGGSMEDRGLRTLLNQCEASLDTPLITGSGDQVHLSEIWVIISRQLTEHAKHSIVGKVAKSCSVGIIDGPVLHDLIQQYMPQLLSDKSTPLDSYMRNLRRFCDSADDYLTARFGARIPLTRCYIPPTLTLSVVQAERLSASADASQACGLSEIAGSIDQYLILAKRKLLPNRRYKRVCEMFARLEHFVIACSGKDADVQREAPSLQQAVTKLRALIDCDFRQNLPVARMSLSSNATPETIESEAGDFLRTWQMQRKFPVLAPMKAEKRQLSVAQSQRILGGKVAREVSEISANQTRIALSAYESCLSNIIGAFTGAQQVPEEFLVIAERIADYLVPPSSEGAGVEPSSNQQICTEVSQALDRVSTILKRRFIALAADLAVFERKPQILIQAELPTALTLSQLTDVLDTLYAYSSSDLVQLIVERPEALVSQVDKLALIADLGFGKSTVLKRLAYNVVAQDDSARRSTIPVFVVLAAVGSPLRVGARTQLLEAAKHSFPGLESRLSEDMLWLLDGLDEMQSDTARQGVTQWMLSASMDAPRRAWITSRPSALTAYIPGLRKARLAPFEPQQIKKYIESFPWTSDARRESLETALLQAPEVAELARMPLLLTLLALLSDSENDVVLPRRREGIYEKILNLFMGDWDRAKGIKREYSIADQQDRIMVLSRAALDLYSRRHRTFSQQDFATSYSASIVSIIDNPSQVAASSFDELLRDSLLVEQPGGQYAFFHFSIHEYLAATALARQVSQQQLWGAVTEYSRDGWWEEVLVFYAGIKRDVGPVISEVHRHFNVSTKAHMDRLRRLLERWLVVADFTVPASLRPGASVIQALISIDPKFANYGYSMYLTQA